jgi:hypothetical protein
MRLLVILDLSLARFVLDFDLGEPLLRIVASDRRLTDLRSDARTSSCER